MTDEEYEKMKAESYNKMCGNLDEEDGYNCTLCNNKGLIQYAKYEVNGDYWHTALSQCKCQKVRKALRQIKESGLNESLAACTFDKYETAKSWQESIKQKAVDFAAHPSGWFFIGGQSGIGKSHLCTAICGKLLKCGIAVKYMKWRDEVIQLKSIIMDSDEYKRQIDEYKTVDVLYIDDLFKNGKNYDGKTANPTSADVQIAFEILNYRYNNKKLLTIISSERTIQQLIEIDEAIAGRISEMAQGCCISVNADSKKNYRLKDVVEF